jgi:hypothetical protein
MVAKTVARADMDEANKIRTNAREERRMGTTSVAAQGMQASITWRIITMKLGGKGASRRCSTVKNNR